MQLQLNHYMTTPPPPPSRYKKQTQNINLNIEFLLDTLIFHSPGQFGQQQLFSLAWCIAAKLNNVSPQYLVYHLLKEQS